MDSLKNYKASFLDEKRTILSDLFSCYQNLSENNLEFASIGFYNATGLWGNREDEIIIEIEHDIDNFNVGEAKRLLYKVIQILINDFSPYSNDKQ